MAFDAIQNPGKVGFLQFFAGEPKANRFDRGFGFQGGHGRRGRANRVLASGDAGVESDCGTRQKEGGIFCENILPGRDLEGSGEILQEQDAEWFAVLFCEFLFDGGEQAREFERAGFLGLAGLRNG